MVRSGLQQDVINLYREGVRNALSKSTEARPSFLLHLRYNFRHPPLKKRDYTAIEHQLRKFSRTLEMLSDPSVQRIHTSFEMTEWWDAEVRRVRNRVSTPSGTSISGPKAERESREPHTQTGGEGSQSGDQWAGKLPGHGGT